MVSYLSVSKKYDSRVTCLAVEGEEIKESKETRDYEEKRRDEKETKGG